MTGGQSVFIRNLIPHLDADVGMVGTTTGREPLGRWQQRTVGGAVYRFMPVARMTPPGRAPRVPLRLTSCLGVARFRRRIIAAGDVMYVHSPEMGVPLVLGPGRKPVAMHVHGSANPLTASRYGWARHPVLRRTYGILWRLVIARSGVVMSVDDAGLDLARSFLPGGARTQLVLVPICVDADLFRPGDREEARRGLGLAGTDAVLLFVGRLEEAKGASRLIAAFARLAATRPELALVLIGDGSQREALGMQARAAGVGQRVTFAGWVDHDVLPAWLRAADVLLLPSDYEGLPTVVIEAMSCGVPVVATAVGGLPALVREGENGLLLHEPTVAALTAATEAALTRTWSAGQVRESVGRYSAAETASRVTALLRGLAGRA